jgi:hypothetical protein
MSLNRLDQCLYCGSISYWKDICRAYREDKEAGRIQVIQGRIYVCVNSIGRRRIKTRVGVPQAEYVQEAYAYLNSFQLRVPQSTQPMPFIRGSHLLTQPMSFIRGSYLPKQPMIDIPGPRFLFPPTVQPTSDLSPISHSPSSPSMYDFVRWMDHVMRVKLEPDDYRLLMWLKEQFETTGEVPEIWRKIYTDLVLRKQV